MWYFMVGNFHYHNAGRRTDFRDKNRELLSGELFSGVSGTALLPENFVPINWLWSGFSFQEKLYSHT